MKDLKSAAILIVAILSVSGCAGTKSAKKTEQLPTPAVVTADAEGPGTEARVNEANIRGSEFGTAPALEIVYFDYDKSSLGDAARTTLSKNADYLKKNPDFDVLVEGHCDERGTIEYNLALGQKRAQTVKDYYMRLGVAAKQVGTISYGKEKPACGEGTEDCWAKNRRGETKVRSRVSSNHTPKPLGTAPEPQ